MGDSARAENLLTNGDFEAEWTGSAPPNWTILYADTVTQQTSPVIGGAVSAHLDDTSTSNMDLYQVPSASPSYWCFDVDFASTDPGIDKRSFVKNSTIFRDVPFSCSLLTLGYFERPYPPDHLVTGRVSTPCVSTSWCLWLVVVDTIKKHSTSPSC